MISIKDNINRVAIQFARFANQIPYAASRAMNSALQDARDSIAGDISKSMTVRSKFTLSGLRVNRSTKKNLKAEIGHIADWMRMQAEGGIKKPTRGKFIAVPQVGAGRPRKTQSAKATLPSKVFAKKNLRTIGKAVYSVDKRRGLKMLYALAKRAEVKPRWPFFKQVEENFTKSFYPYLYRYMNDAIKTAKR